MRDAHGCFRTGSMNGVGCWVCVQLFVTPWTAAHQASLSFTISQSLLTLMSIESVMPPNHLILCSPLLLLSSISPSIRVFSKGSTVCIRWPKYWSFSFSINESSGLISFRRLVWSCSPRNSQESSAAPQFKGTKSLTHSLFYCPALYMTAGKTTALSIWSKLYGKLYGIKNLWGSSGLFEGKCVWGMRFVLFCTCVL